MAQLIQFPPVPKTPATVSLTSGTADVMEIPEHNASSKGMVWYLRPSDNTVVRARRGFEIPSCSEALVYRS